MNHWIMPALLTASFAGNAITALALVGKQQELDAREAALPYPQPGEGKTTLAPIKDHTGATVAHGLFQTDGQLNSVYLPDSGAIVSPEEAKGVLRCDGFQTVGSIQPDGVQIDSCLAIAPSPAGVTFAGSPLVGSSS